MRIQNGIVCGVGIGAAVCATSLWAHSSTASHVAWQACDTKTVSARCSFKNSNGDQYRGSCQSVSDSLMCVRNQPIEKSTAVLNEGATLTETDQLHMLAHQFETATIIEGPSLVDCTLSGGTAARCFSMTVKAEPSTYTPGPWCPEHIADGTDAGGIWLNDGSVHEVDGAFVKNLAVFYNDSNWLLYDEATGKINVTDSKPSCEAAARPDVDPAYQNYCVQCLPEYMSEDAAVTYTIPLNPVLLSGTTQNTGQSGSGIAFNGVRLDGPAPVDAILGSYTLAPFDDCGGHVNLVVGYHYHAATDCLLETGQSDEHGTVVGLAMDGHHIYNRLSDDGELPGELDQCGGHTVEGIGYHYHAGEQGSNAILSCLIAETGCVSETMGADCDASVSDRRGPPDQAGGGRPDFAAAAEKLGITEAALMKALGGPPPDLEKAAETLGVDVQELHAIFK